MKKVALFTLLLFVAPLSRATDVSVGGVSVSIPHPADFSPVTPEMTKVQQDLSLFAAPGSEQLLAFIADADVPAALNGTIADSSRRFLVLSLEGMAGTLVSSVYFEELKSAIKSKNAEILKRVEEDLPGHAEKINDKAAEQYDLDLAFSVTRLIPMPVHEETQRTVAYSALSQYEMNDESGRPVSYKSVVTTTIVHVKEKVLVLLCYAEEQALAWSRAASKQWADAVVADNLYESYRRLAVEHGISIEVPTHWKVASLDERRKFAAAIDESLKETDGEVQSNQIDSLLAISLPDITGAQASLRFRPASGLSQKLYAWHLKFDPWRTNLIFRFSLVTKIQQLRKFHEQTGTAIVGEYEGNIARLGELQGYVIRHRWKSDDGSGVFLEQKFYLPIGMHELIATFSYRQGEGLSYETILERIMGSLRWNEQGEASDRSDP